VLRFAVHPVGRHDRAHDRPAASVIAVIPARFDSTRFPGKPLVDLHGRPMIEHVYRRAAAARGVSRVIVATDDERVRGAVERFGGEAVMTSTRHRSGTDRLAEVAASLTCDVLVNVQGDEPLIQPSAIASAIDALLDAPEIDIATLRYPLTVPAEYESPHVVKVVVDRQGNALYFSRAPIPHERGGHGGVPPPGTFKHIGLYVYRRHSLLALAALEPTPLELAESLEQLRALEHGLRIRTVETAHDTIGVDTPEDLEHVRRLLAGLSVT
jgi:3-deoxy-manno-octulosonate cytidylyltransferase (CMP-KDO synthetase)